MRCPPPISPHIAFFQREDYRGRQKDGGRGASRPSSVLMYIRADFLQSAHGVRRGRKTNPVEFSNFLNKPVANILGCSSYSNAQSTHQPVSGAFLVLTQAGPEFMVFSAHEHSWPQTRWSRVLVFSAHEHN